MTDTGSAGIGNPARSLGVNVNLYLSAVQEMLTSNSDDGWMVYIESQVSYTFDGDGEVKRSGGTFLISRAHGQIAELTIRNDNGDEVVTFVEPNGNQRWEIAKILREAAGMK